MSLSLKRGFKQSAWHGVWLAGHSLNTGYAEKVGRDWFWTWPQSEQTLFRSLLSQAVSWPLGSLHVVFLTTRFSSTGSEIPSSLLMCPRERPRCGLLHRVPVFLLQNSLLGTYLQLRNLSLDVEAEASFPSACLSWKRQAAGKWIISGLEAAVTSSRAWTSPHFWDVW